MTSGPRPTRRTTLVGLCAAVLALVAAVVAAVGPARGERAEYVWPPSTLPAQSPRDGWYAPLPLLNRVPSSIDVRLPCGLAPPLRMDRPVTVLATARHPQNAGALQIRLAGNSLRVSVGRRESASVPWPASCPLSLQVQDGEVRLPTRTMRLETGTPGSMPIVTGLFSTLDLRAGGPPRVVLRTRAYATSPTVEQIVGGVLALTLACVALLLLGLQESRPRLLQSLRRLPASAWRALDLPDAVVVGVLLVWWIVAPTFTDDGWLWVEHRAFEDLGAIGFYYDNWGLSSPLGHWIEWLRHWAIGSTADLVLMRLPSLVAILVSWVLCRWCLRRVVGGPSSLVVRWTLAGAFLVGATAWLMTLRLEPFVSLLTLVSLAALVSFALAPRMAPLTIAVPAAVLAAAAHPSGLVAAAPLLAAAPQVVGWVKASRRLQVAFAGVLVVGLTLALILLALDADLATRLSDAHLIRIGDLHAEPWWREYIRYARFDQYGGGTALRRLSLALLVLSAIAALTRRRSARTAVLLLPAHSVVIGLVLLAFVPSKWPWHFGALATLGAVATASEVERLIREREQPGWAIRPIAVLAAVGAAVVWSWKATGDWSPLDLQERSWDLGFDFGFGYLRLTATLVLTAAFLIVVWRMYGVQRATDRLPTVVAWVVSLASFAAVGVTIAILAIDATTSPWSPTRQNLEALAGGKSCGLAHQLRGESGLADRIADPSMPTLLVPSIGVYFPCATIPTINGGLVQIPRLVAFESTPWPISEPDGPFAAVSDLYGLRGIAQGPSRVEVLSVDDEIPGFVRADAIRSDLRE